MHAPETLHGVGFMVRLNARHRRRGESLREEGEDQTNALTPMPVGNQVPCGPSDRCEDP